ncbi:MAG: hypothetical protein R6V55_05640 [Desulfovermiculus sp.]
MKLVSIQFHFGGQFVDGHRSVECVEDFEPQIIPVRQLLDASLDRRGHPVLFLEFDQGLVRERGELIVTQAFDLDVEFIPDNILTSSPP